MYTALERSSAQVWVRSGAWRADVELEAAGIHVPESVDLRVLQSRVVVNALTRPQR